MALVSISGSASGGNVFYSVGTSTADLKTGAPTIAIAGGTATLSVPQTGAGNVGVGDEIDYGSIAYIKSVVSPTEFVVQTATGGVPAPVGPVPVTSIQRTWNTLALAVANSDQAAYLNTNNLGAAGVNLTWILYKDGDLANASIVGWSTDATHTLTVTAAGASQVASGVSQRHNGTAGSGVVLKSTSSNEVLEVTEEFVTVEWLEIMHTDTGGVQEGIQINPDLSPSQVTVRNNIIHDIDMQGIWVNRAQVVVDIYNNIVYANGDHGIYIAKTRTGAVRILNNTVYNNGGVGIRVVDSQNLVLLQNNISHSNVDLEYEATGAPGSLDGNSSDNLASDVTGVSHSPNGGGINSVLLVNMNFINDAGPIDLHITAGSTAQNNGADLSGIFFADIDWQLRVTPWDIGADDTDATTAVTLVSFEASGLDSASELQWETASELNNLGFHLYRAMSAQGPYERITTRAIPGLGSSPVGARYSYQDTGLANGVTYYYKLEDIETTGKTELHGPVSATPMEGVSSGGDDTDSGGSTSDETASTSLITYGDPTANSFRVIQRDKTSVVLELVTEGFYAEPLEDGSVRLEVPGFESLVELTAPGVPVKRTWVEAVAGRKVKLLSIRAERVEAFTSLRPSGAELPEIVATPEGTVRVARRGRRATRAFGGDGLNPSSAARIVSVGFQGEIKKALVELAPVRWDGTKGQLLLARRLVVRVSFRGREPSELSSDGVGGRRYRKRRSHDQRTLVARLGTTERGLHSVRYEDVMQGRRGVRAKTLRLSRQGETVAFHLEPNGNRFEPGSTLYFLSESASVNPYGGEAVYELEVGRSGESMPEISAAPSGEPTRFYWHRMEWEVNRYYQAGLLQRTDLWLWDVLFAPVVKGYSLEVSALAPINEASKLSVWLQGVSDFEADPDHHVRVSVNGSLVADVSWDGKREQKIDVDLWPGLLHEGDNLLELENVGDTEARYSMVMLDRYELEYPHVALTGEGRLRGRFSESGAAELSGLVAGTHVLDTSGAQPSWLLDTQLGADGMVRFRAESGRSYLAVSPEAVYHPAVTKPRASRLKSTRNRADYLVIGPEAFLQAAIPLLELRQSDGLKVKAVAIEEIYSEFGFGEPTPEAVKDFLSYAYHNWEQPSPRYVLLLGDATFDFKDRMQTGVTNQVPPRMVKTSYLWTVSDPSYAAVNGDDLLPDLAIGRLPAETVEQVQAMVEKIVAYETGESDIHRSAVVLVADNADIAGNFEADADELAAGVLALKNPEKIYLSQLGAAATRNAIVQSFDNGASLVSYVGHGGINLWAGENFFNASDVASLSPQSQQPLLLTMNCLNGYFHFPYFNSLAEELLKAETKGVIAAFSPSGLSLNDPASLYHEALLRELFHGSHGRLGDAVLAAQERYADSGAFPELLSIYHLFGDPALKLR